MSRTKTFLILNFLIQLLKANVQNDFPTAAASFSFPLYYDSPSRPEMRFSQTFGKVRFNSMCDSQEISGACCMKLADTPFIPTPPVARGQVLPVVWSRMSIVGGFSRLSIVPYLKSDNQSEFNLNVVKYGCGESACKASTGEDTELDQRATNCSTSLTIPTYLPNGQYTLQFTRFNSIKPMNTVGFGDIASCIDFSIQGNEAVEKKKADALPIFEGGDIHGSNNSQCLYWQRKRSVGASLGGCINGRNGDLCAGKPSFGSVFPLNYLDNKTQVSGSKQETNWVSDGLFALILSNLAINLQ